MDKGTDDSGDECEDGPRVACVACTLNRAQELADQLFAAWFAEGELDDKRIADISDGIADLAQLFSVDESAGEVVN